MADCDPSVLRLAPAPETAALDPHFVPQPFSSDPDFWGCLRPRRLVEMEIGSVTQRLEGAAADDQSAGPARLRLSQLYVEDAAECVFSMGELELSAEDHVRGGRIEDAVADLAARNEWRSVMVRSIREAIETLAAEFQPQFGADVAEPAMFWLAFDLGLAMQTAETAREQSGLAAEYRAGVEQYLQIYPDGEFLRAARTMAADADLFGGMSAGDALARYESLLAEADAAPRVDWAASGTGAWFSYGRAWSIVRLGSLAKARDAFADLVARLREPPWEFPRHPSQVDLPGFEEAVELDLAAVEDAMSERALEPPSSTLPAGRRSRSIPMRGLTSREQSLDAELCGQQGDAVDELAFAEAVFRRAALRYGAGRFVEAAVLYGRVAALGVDAAAGPLLRRLAVLAFIAHYRCLLELRFEETEGCAERIGALGEWSRRNGFPTAADSERLEPDERFDLAELLNLLASDSAADPGLDEDAGAHSGSTDATR